VTQRRAYPNKAWRVRALAKGSPLACWPVDWRVLPTDWFTGTVRIDSPFKGTDPARVIGAIVTFEPGARTAWHTPPAGPDPYRHSRLRVGAALGRPDPRNSAGRRDLVPAE